MTYRLDKHGIGPNDIRCDECGMWFNQNESCCNYCGGTPDPEQEDEE